ncbi:hypothetical protein AKO1_001865, partial [Acrasis kona]
VHAAIIPSKATSTWKEFFAGALAGVTEILFTQPLIVASVKMKLMESPPTLITLWRDIIKREGLVGIYRGVATNIACVIPWRSVRFASYYVLRNMLTGGNAASANILQQMFSAFITGILETFVITPFDVVQIAQIADRERIEPLYKGNLHCARTILKREGIIKGFYRGFRSTCIRQMIYVTTYLVTYQQAKSVIIPFLLSPFSFLPIQSLTHLLSGMCAGIAGSTMNNPVDVVKTRIQRGQNSSNNKIRGTLQGLSYIAKHEGFWGLYAGIRPKYLKTGLGSAVFFVTYEIIINHI